MKKNWTIYGYVYDPSVDYEIIDADDILDILKGLKIKMNSFVEIFSKCSKNDFPVLSF